MYTIISISTKGPCCMSKKNSIVLIFLYITSFITIFFTAKISGYEDFLQVMTKENGFFETLSLVFLLAISIAGIKILIKQTIQNRFLKFTIISFSILTFVAAMEEISWGQHLFHFQSASFFELYNQQKETNLHNFVDGNIFSSVIYSSVYIIFVFTPLFTYLFQNKIKIAQLMYPFMPSLHIILVILYASAFQIYFFNDVGVFLDFATLTAGLVFFIIIISIKKLWTKYLVLHLLYVLASMIFFMNVHSVFSFFNMQYEIREMFVILATLLFFIEFSNKLQKDNTASR